MISNLVVFALAAQIAASSGPQRSAVRIVSPADGAMVVGQTRLLVEIAPPSAMTNVTFFVDGRQACVVSQPPFECRWDFGMAIAEHDVRVAARFAAGGRIVQAVHTNGAGFTEKVDIDVVQVSVTVMDGRGHYVKDLPKSAFQLAEDGRPQTISHFYAHEVPLEIVVAVDISGSMQRSMPTLKKAVAEFLSAVSPRDRVTLLGFNNRVFSLKGEPTDPAARAKAIDRLVAWGPTALYDVVVRGVEMLAPLTGRKALIVFTDGDDTASHVDVDEVERVLQASDVTVYMIGPGAGGSTPLKKTMNRLSMPTGGRAVFTNSIDDLHDAFAELLEELSNQYGLGYQSTNESRDDTWREIAVTVDGFAHVRARQGYRKNRDQ